MLRALGHPASFLGLLLGFLAAIAASLAAQRAVARALHVPVQPRPAGAAGWIDPFGAVGALLGGPGWGHCAIPAGGFRGGSVGKRCAVLLAGPLAAAAVAAVCLAGYAAAADTDLLLAFVRPSNVIDGVTGDVGQVVPLCAGLEAATVALLGLVPCPPLTGWWVLSALARPTEGWQRLRYYLEDRNIGVVVLLVLVVLPLGGGPPLLLRLVDAIVHAVLTAVTG